MTRPSLPFRTDQPWLLRGRERLADLIFPGGLPADDAAAEPVEPPPPAPEGALIERLAERDVSIERRLLVRGPLMIDLAAILTDEDEAALLDAAGEGYYHHLVEDSEPIDRRLFLIGLGVARDLRDLRARTGLNPAVPPEHVHAMSHAEFTAGGDPWYASMIDKAFTDLGLPLVDGARVLDFGCSSGRAVRMLAARRPDAVFSGCDVNEDAIAWASEALPGIDFRTQPLRPPLAYDEASFDAAYAISIWSHFNAEPARLWLDEMHRIIRPGGLLLITTHGPGAIRFRASVPEHGEVTQRAPLVDLYRSGYSFVASFGDEGDWGVVDHDWGVSFLTGEWMLQTVTPKWSVALHRAAAIDDHQDLWVLRRETAPAT